MNLKEGRSYGGGRFSLNVKMDRERRTSFGRSSNGLDLRMLSEGPKIKHCRT